MALVTSSSRSFADATRRQERASVSVPAPFEQCPGALAEGVDEGTLREYVRMELLVARARAER